MDKHKCEYFPSPQPKIPWSWGYVNKRWLSAAHRKKEQKYQKKKTRRSLFITDAVVALLLPSRLSHVAHTSRSANASQINLLYIVANWNKHTQALC